VNDVERSDSADKREHKVTKQIELLENKTRNKSALGHKPSTNSKRQVEAIN